MLESKNTLAQIVRRHTTKLRCMDLYALFITTNEYFFVGAILYPILATFRC
jgi:hypothetical protein